VERRESRAAFKSRLKGSSRVELGDSRNGPEIEWKICRQLTKLGCESPSQLPAESMCEIARGGNQTRGSFTS
jgi:hypothetical protein